MVSFLLAVALLGQTESTWTIDQPLTEIVNGILAKSNGVALWLPPDVAEFVELADVAVTINGRPAKHRYEFKAELLTAPDKRFLRRLWGVEKSLIVQGCGATTTLTSRVELHWGWDGLLIRRACRRFERRILAFERAEIERLTK